MLETLDEATLWVTRGVIRWNLDRRLGDGAPSTSTTYRAFDALVEHGLVEQAGGDGDNARAYYRITPLGEAYLAGEVDADALEPDGPDPEVDVEDGDG